jgi:DNA-binding MarR family transcriptional regulator
MKRKSKANATAAIESYLPLHPLEFRILLALADGPSHGYRIVKAIEERIGARRRTVWKRWSLTPAPAH